MLFRILLMSLLMLVYALPAKGAHVMHEDAEATVAILMFDGVQIIDFAAPYEVFGQAHFNVYTISPDGEPVTTAMGLNVNVDRSFENMLEADIILVPGGNVESMRKNPRVLDWLREKSETADQLLSVCNGAFIVAGAGLLDGRKATTFHRLFDEFEQNYPGVTLVRDQRWVDNGRVVTSAGLASGIDASLHVVAERLGTRKARSIALHLEYDWSPDQGFVRGLMADRHLRMPEEDFDFPEGTDIDTVLQVGDREHWEIEYEVDSPWGPEELLAHVRERAANDPALTVVEAGSKLQTAWRFESPEGGRWLLEVDASRAADGEPFRVKVELRPAT